MYKQMIPGRTFYRAELGNRSKRLQGESRTPGMARRSHTEILLTEYDARRLQRLIEEMEYSSDDVTGLRREVERAHVVPPGSIRPDVITMNSRARLRDVESGEMMTYTLVFPEQAKFEEERISVLAPIGTAMLGQKKGDEFSWEVPAGQIRLRVEEVLYQPEAAGHHHL